MAGDRPRGMTLGLLARYVRINLLSHMEYRVAFLTQVFGMALNNAFFLLFWAVIFSQVDAVVGYTIRDIMFLYAIIAGGLGLGGVVCGNYNQISQLIVRGSLDVYLLQPKPVLPNLLVARMGAASLGDLGYGLLLFFLSQPLSAVSIVFFLCSMVATAAVYVCLMVFYHSLTFWLGNAQDLASIVQGQLVTTSLYPGAIFQGPVRIVLHTLIPAALLAYLPLEAFEHLTHTGGLPIGTVLAVLGGDLAICALGVGVFYRGLRRYESGNLVGTRL